MQVDTDALIQQLVQNSGSVDKAVAAIQQASLRGKTLLMMKSIEGACVLDVKDWERTRLFLVEERAVPTEHQLFQTICRNVSDACNEHDAEKLLQSLMLVFRITRSL